MMRETNQPLGVSSTLQMPSLPSHLSPTFSIKGTMARWQIFRRCSHSPSPWQRSVLA